MKWILIAIASGLIKIAVADLAGWFPWMAKRLVRASALTLPIEAQHRYEDEWLAELDTLPGHGLSSLIFALRIRVRARSVGRALDGIERHPKRTQFVIKQSIDRAAAATFLWSYAPLFLFVAAIIRTTSRGPILSRQRRVGIDGKEFDVLTFRTRKVVRLVKVTPEGNRALVISGPTRFGHVLQRTALSELPQLINVLRGDISLIGPRPQLLDLDEATSVCSSSRGMKSGLTGWSQVHSLDRRISFDERLALDNYYVTHWSLALDLKIILLTAVALFRPFRNN